jgi:hypothetical protein
LQEEYIKTINPVTVFLSREKIQPLALQICQEDYLPEASRSPTEELDWLYDGTQDRQAFGDLILKIFHFTVECVDVNFGSSRYAER